MGTMSEEPPRDRLAADEQRIGALLRAVEGPAPEALQQRIAAMAAPRAARRRARTPAFALALAVVVAVVVVASLAGGARAPTVAQAAQSALAPPSRAAPPALVAAGTTIVFPDWSAQGWPPAGERTDAVNGRAVTTVFYDSPHAGRLGYSIVSGAPLVGVRSPAR